jgi:hypothetical protein
MMKMYYKSGVWIRDPDPYQNVMDPNIVESLQLNLKRKIKERNRGTKARELVFFSIDYRVGAVR